MKKAVFLLLLLLNKSFAQSKYTIEGHFPNFPHSTYELKGFDGLKTTTLTTAEGKENGKFVLSYPENYIGIAHLYMNGAFQNIFFLNKENINIFWDDLTKRDAMQLTNSKEYDAFVTGMKTYQVAEAKLAGWNYLLPLYEKDSIKQKVITNELQLVNESFPSYIKSLPENIWVKHYLLAKGLIEQMPNTVKTYPWRAAQHVPEFMAIDFKSLKHAGLYIDIIEGYTTLIERMPLNEVVPLLNQAIDKVVTELKEEPGLQQELAQHWFTFLEKHSLVASAEHLALRMLNQDNCVLNAKSTDMFEQYRKLGIGKIAPNINLSNNKTLKNVNNKYKLLVFGASWCPNCQKEYPLLKDSYADLKKKYDLEMVYLSIDTDKTEFETYYKDAPFITFYDGKGWETQSAKDYHVFATPTYLLLDKDLKILARIKSPEHLDAWLKANN